MRHNCYFDLTTLNNPYKTGIENYTSNLFNLVKAISLPIRKV